MKYLLLLLPFVTLPANAITWKEFWEPFEQRVYYREPICTEVVYQYLTEITNLTFNKVYYPKYYAQEYSGKDLNMILGDQYKIYDADFGNYFIAFLILVLFIIIISIGFRSYSMYKFYKN